MARKKIVVVNRPLVEQQFLRGLFSSGLTSVLRKPSAARWGFSGGTLVDRSWYR